MLAAAAAGGALSARAMETMPLDGMWDFAFAEGAKLEDAGAKFAPADRMPVPCCFDLTPRYYMKRGTAMYRRRFELAKGVPGAYLKIKGMGLRARFWIDGREIGSSSLAFSELEFATGPLAAGGHEIAAALDNRVFAGDSEMFQPYYDFLGSGGFYHGVELRLQKKEVELDRVYVRNRDFKTGKVEIALRVRSAADGADVGKSVDAKVSFDGAAPETVRFERSRATLHVPGFKLWSPTAPNLHKVRVEIPGTGEAEARFGVREFKCAKGKFWLNGEPVFLKGVNRHDSDAADGYATSRQSMWRDITLIKGLGANFVRTSHYPPCEDFLDMCDEAGLLVWEETLGWQNNARQTSNGEYAAQSLEQARIMARKSINHPSVVIDAFMNEFRSDLPACKKHADALINALRKEDTGHAVTFASAQNARDVSNEKTDFVAFNHYPWWHHDVGAQGTPENVSGTIRRCFGNVARMFRKRHGKDRPIMIGETGCYALYGCRDAAGVQWSEEFQAEYLGDSVRFAIEDPDVQGVAVWQFSDTRTYFRGGGDIRTKPLGQNMAGLFDIHRREKLAAKTVRALFSEEKRPAP